MCQVRALAVETHEGWLEDSRYLNLEYWRDHRRQVLRHAARNAPAAVTGASSQSQSSLPIRPGRDRPERLHLATGHQHHRHQAWSRTSLSGSLSGSGYGSIAGKFE